MTNNSQTNSGVGSIGDDEVRDHTGFEWQEWQLELDAWDASHQPLKTVIAHLIEKYGLSRGWALAVATHYFVERWLTQEDQ